MGFAIDVLSREEAMALPPKERPLCYRVNSRIYTAVFEAMGAASTCWKPDTGSAVFASEQAAKVATDLCFLIADELDKLKPDREPGE